MSPQMKLADKPNKIGRKKWKLIFACFHVPCPKVVHWENLLPLFTFVSEKRKAVVFPYVYI